MKRINLSTKVASLLSITALCMMFSAVASNASAKTVYCKMAQDWWKADGAAVAAHMWGGSSATTWPGIRMTQVSGATDVWSIDAGDNPNIIFVRVNGSGNVQDWGAQTADLTIPTDDKNLYTITSTSAKWSGEGNKVDGVWSVYGEGGGDTPGGDDPVVPTEYDKAVPSECQDVMLQAFYWLSNEDNSYGGSQWSTLKSQADEISAYFDLVWLPPSCNSNDKMGYLPKEYHNQNSKMGMRATLTQLIAALHNGGTRVIADVVINHAANKSSWVDFMDQDFGTTYGKFSPQSTWITSNDEAQGHGQLGSNADDGQESNANYGSARDWDHKNSNVQTMFRAYLKWLKNVMLYDGFRFDYCGGYHVSHVNDYVSNAKPYFSVMEYWNGNASTLKQRIDDANKNTLTFDFAQFYTAFQQGIAGGNYSKLVKPGLRGQGYSKYAVTFIDNHDTFNRSDIGNSDCGNSKDGSSSLNNKSLIMQCNAYLLSMPGVPCVFWPHWYKYKSDIKQMIHARKMAGIHSESTVQEESGSGYYRATIQGKYGSVKLMLGSAASDAQPQGYTQAVKGSTYAMYYTGSGNAIENVEVAPLDVTKPMFTMMGQQVDASYRGVVIQNGHKYILQ